jgi:hypothetical protein
MNSSACPTCGGVKFQYSPSFRKLWEEAMRFFPLYALPEIETCVECLEYKAGLPVGPFYRERRKQWLRSGDPIVKFDESDPIIVRQLRVGKKLAVQYRKLLAQQKAKMLKIRTKRFMKKQMRPFKQREKAIREVLERAAEL